MWARCFVRMLLIEKNRPILLMKAGDVNSLVSFQNDRGVLAGTYLSSLRKLVSDLCPLQASRLNGETKARESSRVTRVKAKQCTLLVDSKRASEGGSKKWP